MADKKFEKMLYDTFEWFHQNPELSYEEFNTTKRIIALLREKNIEILDTNLNTGLAAVIRGKKGKPVIAIRCDIDALPINEETKLPYKSCILNKMHACGHDFHITSIIGAAYLLKELEDKLEGTVKLIFQPAEESSHGAEKVIKSGILEDVEAIFGLHAFPNMPVGTISLNAGNTYAAVDRFVINVEGIGCHAARPHEGIDSIVISSQIVTALQTIVSRNVDPFDQGLISVTSIQGGNTWNVIPSSAKLEGTVRTLKRDTRELICSKMKAISENFGRGFGANVTFHWFPGPPATDNNSEWVDFASVVAKEEDLKVIKAAPTLAGEDFAYYQEKIKGVFIDVGIGDTYPLHHPKFKVDKGALIYSSRLFAAVAKKALIKLSKIAK